MRKVVFALAMVIAVPVWSSDASALTKTELKALAAKYKKARKLQKAGRFMEAVPLFQELRETLYHPRIDYRLGQCFEGAKDYVRAVNFYNSYLKYRGQYKVGKKDPSVESVQAKVASLKTKFKAPPLQPTAPEGTGVSKGTTTPTDGATEATSTSGSLTPVGTAGTTSEAAGTNTAGPTGTQTSASMASMTAPPPPRPPANRGSAQVYYDPYMEVAPPPLGPIGVRRAFPRFNAFYVTADVAYTYLAGDLADMGFTQGGAGVGVGLYWRPIQFLSAGLTTNILYAVPDNDHPDLDNITFALAGGEVRGQFPLFGWGYRAWAMELWGALGAGFSYSEYKSGSGTLTKKMYGSYASAALGFKVFVTPWLSTGVLARVFRPFYSKACSTGTLNGMTVDGCSTSKQVTDENDTIIYVGLSSTAHFYLF